jgi:hypothetical protein
MCASGAKGDQRSVGLKRNSPPTQAGLFRYTVTKLAMDLSSVVVDNQYFKVLIVPQAVIAEVLRDLFARLDRFGIRVRTPCRRGLSSGRRLSYRKKLSHGQSSIEAIAEFSSLPDPPPAIACMQIRQTTRLRSGYLLQQGSR